MRIDNFVRAHRRKFKLRDVKFQKQVNTLYFWFLSLNMERRDYLITQIQQLGQFIRILVEKLLGKSSPTNLEQLIVSHNEEFREKCGFPMQLLAAPDIEELKNALLELNSFNSENIELLADYMALMAQKIIDSPPTLLYRLRNNALKLYELIEVNEKAYSLERQKKITELKLIL